MLLIVPLDLCTLAASSAVVIRLHTANYIVVKNSSSTCCPGLDYYSCLLHPALKTVHSAFFFFFLGGGLFPLVYE